MHPALGIQEVVYCIAEQADRDALVQLARVCRTTWRPAVSVLWRALDSLDPLTNLIPVEGSGDSNLGIVPLSILHVKRLLTLGSFVRSLKLSHEHTNSKYAGWLGSLLRLAPFRRQVDVLVPCLRALEAYILNDADAELAVISLLLIPVSASLRTLRLHFTISLTPHEGTSRWLMLLPERVPQLVKIDMTTGESIGCTADFLRRLPSLREGRLSVFDLSHSVLLALANLSLRSLSLHCLRTVSWDSERVGLEHLRSLTVDASIESSIKILRSLTAPLTRLDLQLSNNNGLTDMRGVTSMISAQFPHLRSLRMPVRTLASSAASFAVADVIPLYECHALESVEIIAELCPFWDDIEFSMLAQSWPLLKQLAIWCGTLQHANAHCNIHLRALVYLARNCPNLEQVSISIDMRGFEWPTQMCGPSRNMHFLILYSPTIIDNTDQAKDFIRALWPNVLVHSGSRLNNESAKTITDFCYSFNGFRLDSP